MGLACLNESRECSKVKVAVRAFEAAIHAREHGGFGNETVRRHV
jgi:hypothetical protein